MYSGIIGANMKVSAVVLKGNNKKICEDCVLIGETIICDCEIQMDLSETCMVCVADGVGGNSGGEVASRFILSRLSKYQILNCGEEIIKRNLIDLNNELLNYAESTNDKKRMATTFTGLFCDVDDMYFVQSGNSRLYIMQGNYLKQITKDQTTYQWLKDCGNDEAAEICNKNEIRGCFGGGNAEYIEPLVVKKIENSLNISTIILTSDGIHEYVDIDAMEELLASGQGDIEILRRMTMIAMENGSQDDITAIVVRR